MVVIAYNTVFNALYRFPSANDVVSNIEGIEIAESDWLFFSEDGSPMEAIFSVPARINPEKHTYSNGVYSLKKTSGQTLHDTMSNVPKEREKSGNLYTPDNLRAFLIDDNHIF